MAETKDTTNKGDGDGTSSAGSAPRQADLPPNAAPPNPPVDTTVDDKASEKDQFRQQKAAEAALQGQPNGVPEQRPQAFLQPGDAGQSKTYLALKENEHPLAHDEPMDKAAYDRANSDSQAKKAEKASRVPTLREGERVRITKKEPGVEDRNAVIIQVHYSDEELQRREAGRADAAYAEAETYVVRTRDGRSDTFELKPDEVEAVPAGDWGRSAI